MGLPRAMSLYGRMASPKRERDKEKEKERKKIQTCSLPATIWGKGSVGNHNDKIIKHSKQRNKVYEHFLGLSEEIYFGLREKLLKGQQQLAHATE
jgi:hypothetical protein